jgi:2,4-dienoyl-CoA reductase-like NADH-dependent reductase (Old Yellow Enzyme family)
MPPDRYPHLFQPIKVGKLILKNRITNAPTYNFLASYDNHITREGIEFSKPVGRGGAATVTLGSGFINKVLPAAAHHIVGLNDDWVVTVAAIGISNLEWPPKRHSDGSPKKIPTP